MIDRAAELKAAFDRGFAEASRGALAATVDLLRIQIGGAPFAMQLSEIATLQVDVRICAVPTSARELLGVAQVRSELVAIYDLRALLGSPTAVPPRWCVIARRASVGLAFDGFDGLLRVGALPAAAEGRRTITIADRNVPLLDLGSIVESLQHGKER